ncbi:MAG: hypothetical protein AAB932_05705 [Patescibacteria group bacterium]
MKHISLLIQTILLFAPLPLLAHDDPSHATESTLYQIFHPEHLLFYGIPTLAACVLVYRSRKKLFAFLLTKKEKTQKRTTPVQDVSTKERP